MEKKKPRRGTRSERQLALLMGKEYVELESLIVRGRDRGPAPIRLGFKNEVYEFSGGTRAFTLE